MGVYKHWTGLLEWWNSGMVDWIVSSCFIILLCCDFIVVIGGGVREHLAL